MNNHLLPRALWLTLALLATLNPQLSTVFAQGSLTPPGAPAPLFKTLAQVEPRTPISSLPFSISVSGSYYLTTNLNGGAGGGIGIGAADVTLDLMGFALVGGTGDGINIGSSRTNVAIRNGTVRGWSGDGIDATSLSDGLFQDLRVFSNGGNGLNAGSNSLVNFCMADKNGINGIVASTASVIQNCAARANVLDGIHLIPPGNIVSGGQIINCITHSNSANGITVSKSQILNCFSANNGAHGMDVGTRSTVSGCKVTLNPLDGVRAGGGCLVSGNHIVGSGTALGTTNACIMSFGSTGNRIEDNHVAIHDNGIVVTGGNNFIFRNTAQGCTTSFSLASGNSIGPTNTVSGIVTNHPWANISF